MSTLPPVEPAAATEGLYAVEGPGTVVQKFLFVAMVVGSVAVLTLPFLPIEFTISHLVNEDIFYYLTAARNIAEGHVASIDGKSPTNGFHPLWMIICVGIESLFKSQPNVAFHCAILLCAVLFVATGWTLYRVVRLYAGETIALVVGTLFLCNYRLASIPMGGLESALYGFSVVVLLRWLVLRGNNGVRTIREAVVLGLLLAFIYWSRMDAILLGGFVCLGILYLRRSDPFATRLVLAGIAAVTSLVATLPWFAFSFLTVGALLPRSGDAIQSWSGYAVDPSQSLTANIASFARFKAGSVIDPFNDIANVLGFWPFIPPLGDAHSILRYVGALVLVAAVLGLTKVLIAARRAPRLQPFHWIPFYAIALTIYYLICLNISMRYAYPVYILMAFYLAVGTQWLLSNGGFACSTLNCRYDRRPERVNNVVAGIAVCMLFSSALTGMTAYRHGYGANRFNSLHIGFYDYLAPWIESNTEQDAVVGGFNCGIISYYSGRRVVNLDGVMNDAAIEAIQTRTLGDYIANMRINYLADIDAELVKFMDKFSGNLDWRSEWRPVYSVTIPTMGGISRTKFTVLQKMAANK